MEYVFENNVVLFCWSLLIERTNIFSIRFFLFIFPSFICIISCLSILLVFILIYTHTHIQTYMYIHYCTLLSNITMSIQTLFLSPSLPSFVTRARDSIHVEYCLVALVWLGDTRKGPAVVYTAVDSTKPKTIGADVLLTCRLCPRN